MLLGVQALERQQAELERRRDKALQSRSAQQEQRAGHIRKQNPFDTEGGMAFSNHRYQPQDYHPSGTGVPNMVHLVDGSMMSVSNNSEETKMADDAAANSNSIVKKIGRSSSFSRFLTPLVSLWIADIYLFIGIIVCEPRVCLYLWLSTLFVLRFYLFYFHILNCVLHAVYQ